MHLRLLPKKHYEGPGTKPVILYMLQEAVIIASEKNKCTLKISTAIQKDKYFFQEKHYRQSIVLIHLARLS